MKVFAKVWMAPLVFSVVGLLFLIDAPNQAQDEEEPPRRDPQVQIHELHLRMQALEAAMDRMMAEGHAPLPPPILQPRDGLLTDFGLDMMGRTVLGHTLHGGGTDSGGCDSSLPGFPGASHLYHIGATMFFLDHTDHVELMKEQEILLRRIRTKAVLKHATLQRQIEQAEQDLWVLTCGEWPDSNRIEAKIREIEGLQSQKRLSFIRSVGQAAKVLTEEQRKILSGMAHEDH